jgi:4-amino-4-deoxy-L-arabinose transferase-like glycosyltransferase
MKNGTNSTEPKWLLAVEWAALLALVALATYLRYWRIEEVPPGFNSDEAVGAMGALTTLREGFKYSYEGQGGGGALGFYFAAASFYLFGPSIAAIRGLAAWAGVVSIFANYWAVRELFRSTGLNRARWIAGLATLGLAVSLWHISASRVVFAGIGVPFLLLPSIYFLWRGLNSRNNEQLTINKAQAEISQSPISNLHASRLSSILYLLSSIFSPLWPFIISGIFLGALMYIYLSGIFAPPFYTIFFGCQWLIVKITKKFKGNPDPAQAYLTTRFWPLFATATTAAVLLLPMIYVLLFRPELEPGTTRASQAIFTNPQINQGDPWGLLWRSFSGNFSAYGISLSWFIGRPPSLSSMPVPVGLIVFLGFLLTLWYSLQGKAVYLFALLWFCIMLLPSILAPDVIPHNLRAIGATSPTYIFAAIFIAWLFESLWTAGQRWIQPRLGQSNFAWLARGLGLTVALGLLWLLGQTTATILYNYFYIFPTTNDAKAAYHVYAVELAEVINQEPSANVAFILPRNTAAGDVFRNFTTDFLTELAQPSADHYWVIDNEYTLATDLTQAAAGHSLIRVVQWKTSKHTGADPKAVIPYYLEKYGHYDHSDSYDYFDIHTYQLEIPAPDFQAAETLLPVAISFGQQLQLIGYALGDAGNPQAVARPQAGSNELLWLRLAWQKTGEQPENLKVSALIYTTDGQLVAQIDKLLLSNILQVGSAEWQLGAQEETYFLIHLPPATPPGNYILQLAVYGADSLARLPIISPVQDGQAEQTARGLLPLANFTVTPAQKPVKPDDLDLALPVRQTILPGLTLVGFETLPGETVRSGAQVGASLIWQAGDTPPADDLTMLLIAQPKEGQEAWSLSEPAGLAGPGYPTSAWQPGELLRGWLKARVPPSFEPGIYELSLRLATADNSSPEVLTLPIGDFKVEGWPRNFEPPQPSINIGGNYGELAALVGLDAEMEALSPGQTLTARLYWQALAEFSQNYTAFVQLIGPDGRLYGQVDQTPGAGAFPTTGWLPGEYITDEYAISLAADAPTGAYQVAIGLYNPETGQRLPVSGGDCQFDACLLPGLMVK